MQDKTLNMTDALYTDLLALHDNLTEAESAALNARLILLMMNHIGDENILKQLFKAAKDNDLD